MKSPAHDRDLAATAEYFSRCLREHRRGPKALDWPRRKSQELRFQVLAEAGVTDGCSVLDVGCGLADFHAWLVRRGLRVRYTGVDICGEMIAAARRRFPHLDLRHADVLGSSLPRKDWVVASGIFYLRRHRPYEFMRQMAARMLELASRGVAFNCLSAVGGSGDDGEFRADPARALRILRPLAPRMLVRMDYHPADFTVYLLKKPFDAR